MLKLPKMYRTVGDTLKIRREKVDNSSYFNIPDGLLVIDKANVTDFEIVSDLIHEELEASLANLGHRYTNWKKQTVFAFNHDQLHDVVGELARGVLDLLKANRK